MYDITFYQYVFYVRARVIDKFAEFARKISNCNCISLNMGVRFLNIVVMLSRRERASLLFNCSLIPRHRRYVLFNIVLFNEPAGLLVALSF